MHITAAIGTLVTWARSSARPASAAAGNAAPTLSAPAARYPRPSHGIGATCASARTPSAITSQSAMASLVWAALVHTAAQNMVITTRSSIITGGDESASSSFHIMAVTAIRKDTAAGVISG